MLKILYVFVLGIGRFLYGACVFVKGHVGLGCSGPALAGEKRGAQGLLLQGSGDVAPNKKSKPLTKARAGPLIKTGAGLENNSSHNRGQAFTKTGAGLLTKTMQDLVSDPSSGR